MDLLDGTKEFIISVRLLTPALAWGWIAYPCWNSDIHRPREDWPFAFT